MAYIGTFLAVAAFVGSLASAWFSLQARVDLLEWRVNNSMGEYHAPAEAK